jgi:hypothetical protein
VGHYSANVVNETVSKKAVKEVLCPAGWHCSGGAKTQCTTPGKYCPEGSNAPADCTAGFYCPTPERQDPCKPGLYCPKGSWDLTLSKCPEGATCTVPASPELIIEFDAALEKREREVATGDNAQGMMGEMQHNVGEIEYTLLLSVQPRMDVKVQVRLQEDDPGTAASCVVHDHGLRLNGATEFIFNRANWNVPQTVQIAVKREIDTYQGNTVTRFAHFVTSTDPDWQAPFLRPMTVAISDDDECTEGAQKYDALVCAADKNCYSIRKCGCQEGFFTKDTDSEYCGSVTACAECSPGMVCRATSDNEKWLGVNSTLEKLVLDPGYFRISEKVTSVIECPVENACTTNSTITIRTAGDALCDRTLGHEGPLCMVCHTGENETWYWEGQKCVLCEGEKQNAIMFFAVIFGTSLLLVVDAAGPGISRKVLKKAKALFKRRYPTMGKWIEKQKEVMEELTLKLQTKCNVTKSRPAPRSFLFQPAMRPKLICLDAAIVGFVGLCSLYMLPSRNSASSIFLLQIKSSSASSKF